MTLTKGDFVKKWAENIAFLVGLSGILIGVFERESDISGRIFYVVLGLCICIFSKVRVARWIFVSILFLGVGITGIPNIFSTGNFDASYALLVFMCFFVALFFGTKVLRTVKNRRINSISDVTLQHIDLMSGLEFEEYTARLLNKLGYTNVTVTKASGDQGIDVLARKDGVRYAIQCKNYSGKLGNTPVQEVYAGKDFYGCDVGVVITNSTFTAGAYELANRIGVLLWDRNILQDLIYQTSKQSHVKRFKQSGDFAPSADAYVLTVRSDKKTDDYSSESSQPAPENDVSQFIAEAQWYAAQDGADLLDEE